jgi:hypothetical protein
LQREVFDQDDQNRDGKLPVSTNAIRRNGSNSRPRFFSPLVSVLVTNVEGPAG